MPDGFLYRHEFLVAGCLILMVGIVLALAILLLSSTNHKDDRKGK